MTKSISILVGLALLLVGAGLIITNQPISEDEAIQGAAKVTTGADGQKMYEITGRALHNAAHQRQNANASRAREFWGHDT